MNDQKHISAGLALIPLVVMAVSMGITISVFDGDPQAPILLGAAIAALIAWLHGYQWDQLEGFIYDGIRTVLPAVVVIMLVGFLISSWIAGGIVGTMIFYGLKILSPKFFLAVIMVICFIVATVMGSSWSTIATIGVAGMGIGMSMNIPSAMIAGAVVSGAYLGDKMSPLSDTTILAAGVTETKISQHIRHMLYTTIPGSIIALIVYTILGLQFSQGEMDAHKIQGVMDGLQSHFIITPWLFLIPLAVIILVVMKMPALPALSVGIVLGLLADFFIQGGDSSKAINALQEGYQIDSGNQTLDQLLNQGGLESMMYTVSLAIIAMIFGSLLEKNRYAESTG